MAVPGARIHLFGPISEWPGHDSERSFARTTLDATEREIGGTAGFTMPGYRRISV